MGALAFAAVLAGAARRVTFAAEDFAAAPLLRVADFADFDSVVFAVLAFVVVTLAADLSDVLAAGFAAGVRFAVAFTIAIPCA